MPQRVVVVGVTGSGKTTFAAALAARLGVPCIELDALHWEPNWVMAELDVFRERVARAVAGDAWVADGNYAKARDLVWERAHVVVWLDYAFWLIFFRLLRRTLSRVFARTELYSGNRERFTDQFLSRDSLFVWAMQKFPEYRATFPALFASERYQHLQVVRLRTPRAAQIWLRSMPGASATIVGSTE